MRATMDKLEDELESIVGRMLAERKLTLATAESCTGGLLGHRITDVPGSMSHLPVCTRRQVGRMTSRKSLRNRPLTAKNSCAILTSDLNVRPVRSKPSCKVSDGKMSGKVGVNRFGRLTRTLTTGCPNRCGLSA